MNLPGVVDRSVVAETTVGVGSVTMGELNQIS